jgi:hypothetical protein
MSDRARWAREITLEQARKAALALSAKVDADMNAEREEDARWAECDELKRLAARVAELERERDAAWQPASVLPDVEPGHGREFVVWIRYQERPGGYVTTAEYLNQYEMDEWDDEDDGVRSGWHFQGPTGAYDEYFTPADRVEWWAPLPPPPAAAITPAPSEPQP